MPVPMSETVPPRKATASAAATPSVDFGYEEVPAPEKARRVRAVFDSVADKYDIMNDLMSAGVHRLWKRYTLSQTGLRPGMSALDVAGGTGDIAAGMAQQVQFSLANAECLPFADETFDCVTIGFGLRNVTDKTAAIASMRRVLKPGGRLLILEFSKPVFPGLKPVYDAYSFSVLPWLGARIANDPDSYRYLAESIRRFPDQETLLGMMRDAGLEDCRYHNLTGGIVALHKGFRY